MTAQIVIPTLDFACEPWRIEGEHAEKIEPVPGTWTLAPEPIWRTYGVRGIISCPRCGAGALVREDQGTVKNGVFEMKGFKCQCDFACYPRLLQWDTRKLFCVAYKVIDEKSGLPMIDKHGEFVRKEYCHAETREIAFRDFVLTHQKLGRHHVIDVAPVIGYFFDEKKDKDAKDLSV